MLLSVFVCISIFLFATTISGAEPSANEVLQLALDAQLTRESQWKEGTMDAVISTTGPSPMTADFTLAWNEKGVYVNLRKQTATSLSLNGKREEEERRPFRRIFTAREEWSYIPSLAEGFGVGMGRLQTFSGELDVRPLKVWGTFPGIPQLTLAKTLRRALDDSANVELSQVDGGLTRIQRKTGNVFFIDVASGGDLVRFEHNMHEEVEVTPGIDPGMVRATYEWARDEHGVPYCRKFKAEHFRPDGSKEPGFVREVEVTSYSSRLSKEEARFDLDRLEIPKGTRVRYSAPGKNRSWRYGISGSESDLLQQPDFDRLINETKQSGFAAPKNP